LLPLQFWQKQHGNARRGRTARGQQLHDLLLISHAIELRLYRVRVVVT
jgi:hypothetical protein